MTRQASHTCVGRVRGRSAYPAHWHRDLGDGTVVHDMRDPRTIEGYSPTHWTPDERAYVEHLREHEADFDPAAVTALDSDPELVTMLIALADAKQAQAVTLRKIVVEIRREMADGVALHDTHGIKALAGLVRKLDVPREQS